MTDRCYGALLGKVFILFEIGWFAVTFTPFSHFLSTLVQFMCRGRRRSDFRKKQSGKPRENVRCLWCRYPENVCTTFSVMKWNSQKMKMVVRFTLDGKWLLPSFDRVHGVFICKSHKTVEESDGKYFSKEILLCSLWKMNFVSLKMYTLHLLTSDPKYFIKSCNIT